MKKLFWITIILLLAGLINCVYITVETAQGGGIGCYVVEGCDRVLTSPYASIFGISVSIFGIAYYLLGIVFLLLARQTDSLKRIFFWYICLGIAISLVFIYIQAFVLRAFCSSCLLSALLVFVIGISAFFMQKHKNAILTP